jgi:hypothetical protein
MKEFKRLQKPVYRDKSMRHTFTDSAPHAKFISPDYYKEAERTAEKIHSTQEGVETFIVGPPQYEDSYEFFGVHNKCSRNGIEFHEVCVPGVPSAIGAAGTLEEALTAAAEMLTIMLGEMQSRGEAMPVQQSQDSVEEYGQKEAIKQVDGFEIRFCDVVVVRTVVGLVPEMSESELAKLEDEALKIWRTLSGGSC